MKQAESEPQAVASRIPAQAVGRATAAGRRGDRGALGNAGCAASIAGCRNSSFSASLQFKYAKLHCPCPLQAPGPPAIRMAGPARALRRPRRTHSVRHAIRPGISASASSISRRPKSAWDMSLTLYCRQGCRGGQARAGRRQAAGSAAPASGGPIRPPRHRPAALLSVQGTGVRRLLAARVL